MHGSQVIAVCHGAGGVLKMAIRRLEMIDKERPRYSKATVTKKYYPKVV